MKLSWLQDIKVREDNVKTMFEDYAGKKIGLSYDPMKTITHVRSEDDEFLAEQPPPGTKATSQFAGLPSTKSLTGGELAKSKTARMEDVEQTSQVDGK